MFLQTHDNWEIRNPLIQALDLPGTHRYAMVEIALNLPLFLLEASAPPASGELSVWQRFLLTNFEDVQGFLSTNKLEDHRLNLLLPRHLSESYEYTISTIIRIYSGTDPDGHRHNLYIGESGRRFLDAMGLWNESDLIEKVLIYEKDKPVAPDSYDWEDDDGLGAPR